MGGRPDRETGGVRRRLLATALTLLLALAAAAGASARDFENPASNDSSQQFGAGSVQRQDTPNDPNYDQAEPDTQNRKSSSNLYDERFDLFGFPSQLTPTALYRDGPFSGRPMVAGFNAAGAWKITRGRADVTVAVLDSGIQWSEPGLRDKLHLNTGELPLPERADGSVDPGAPAGGYDLYRHGVVDVDQYSADPRVRAVMPPGERAITGEDLIRAFGNCEIVGHMIRRCVPGLHFDNDRNGYANDIAGWNFFDDSNDPLDRSSYFAADNHGTGRALDGEEQGNDAQGSIGTCPHCQYMPIRVWDTFVSDGNTFGLGITYATDNGAKVIEGSDGSLYHSAFAEGASRYAYDHGVSQVYSGDDLNTGNHNYPANYSHTMLIQGTVPDTVGLGKNAGDVSFAPPGLPTLGGLPLPVGTQAPVGTFFRGANTTQYGGHSSISMEGTTGSQNTGKAAGGAGLVVSAALDRGVDLSADEVREILEQTAEPVTALNTLGVGQADPGASPDGFATHFGYGRANLGAAVALARSGAIPPEVSIGSPDWYAPLSARSAEITGKARARFASGGAFHWKLEWGAGLAPDHWVTAREGDSTGTVTDFGSIDLDQVRAALAATPVPADPGGPTFAAGALNPFQHQFAVRVVVIADGIPTPGVDRKAFTVLADATLRPGYPKRLGTGGEAPLRYADLNGDNVPELLVPGEDGVLRALEPDGRELRGWPVRTALMKQAADHPGAPAIRRLPPAREAPRAPVVADLTGSGRPQVITAAGMHIYVWEANGRLRRGFPVASDPSFCREQDESQPLHHRKCGFLASPALAHLEGSAKPLDIVASSLDGHLYAFRPDGTRVPGFPVNLVDPGVPADRQMLAESIGDPAIADLNGDGKDDVIVSSNEFYGASQSLPGDVSGGFAQGLADILGGAAGGSSRVYAINGADGKLLPGWPIKMNGAIQNVLPLIGPGQDAAVVKLGGRPTVVASTTGGALAEYAPDGTELRAMQQSSFGPASNATDRTNALNLFESAAVGDVLGTGTPAVVKYGVTLGQVLNLALSGQNFPYNHLIGAYDASSGQSLPAYPTVTDDYQFLSSSTIAKISPGGVANQVVAGTGLGLLHAYDGATGHDVSGFPKETGGWLFSPAALATDGRLAAITREGYLFEWESSAPACQNQWPSFRHDAHGSGNYDHDGTPPAAPGSLSLRRTRTGAYRLTFKTPGDDFFCGNATRFEARVDGKPAGLSLGPPRAGGSTASYTISLPARARIFSLDAIDKAGNVGPRVDVSLARVRAQQRRRALRHRHRRSTPRLTA
ncbi:MAG: hypothetical protein NVSMB25_07360 [Thermoleophilaceae bacterium]